MSQHIGHRIRGGTYSTYVTGSTVGEPTGSINGTNENDASLSVKYSVFFEFGPQCGLAVDPLTPHFRCK